MQIDQRKKKEAQKTGVDQIKHDCCVMCFNELLKMSSFMLSSAVMENFILGDYM